MNITHELHQLECGGVEKVIRNIIKFDKKNLHTIVAYRDGPFRKELEAAGAKIIIAPKEKQKEAIFDVDIVHIHSGGAISEMATNLGKAFPIVETIHCPVRSPMRDELIRQRVGVTDAVAKMNSKCITIHNGIDFTEMEPTKSPKEIKKELGIREGVSVVGRIGRIGKDKCMEEWILTCYYLQKNDLDFVPLIVGAEALNLDGYIGKLNLMAESLPVKGIIWAGHHLDIANYLQMMDIFLYPSPTEGFGLVFAEAMYAGSIVVTYNNDVSREVCGGFSILTGKAIADLANGVKQALDINMKDAIIPLAKSWVEEEFEAERMSKDYQDLYDRIYAETYGQEKTLVEDKVGV